MIDAHHESGASISIATLPVNAKEAPEFGILKTDSETVSVSTDKLYNFILSNLNS